MLPTTKRRGLFYKSILVTTTASLLFLLLAFSNHDRTASSIQANRFTVTGDTTAFNDTALVSVAALIPSADGRSVTVIFNEREQVFSIPRGEKNFDIFNRSFEASLKSKSPLKVITNPRKGSFTAVTQPSATELELFKSLRREMLPGDKAERIEISKIDTATFNIVGEYLKWPVFRKCTSIVPDYATAKQIFDYCAQQSCDIFGPHQVNPCIPFQYVIDGCYARAHKMRWIIENHFHYCSEKVFSFANQGNHCLAVQANKWGGCCVQWWFHVTPVIRVKSPFGKFGRTLAYVIDPGMFNQPVLLSTWLQAQENLACSANAHVDFYSIQPSSAYLPTYPTGAPYTTDPNYTATNNTLIGYANGHTCN